MAERLLQEFNQAHANVKFSPAYHLLARKAVEPWYHKIRICHFFTHPRYNQFTGSGERQLPLQP